MSSYFDLSLFFFKKGFKHHYFVMVTFLEKKIQLTNEFHNIKPVYFEDAQVDHCYAPFEVTVEK